MSAVALALVVALFLVVKMFIGFMTDSIFPLTQAVNRLEIILSSKSIQADINNSLTSLVSMPFTNEDAARLPEDVVKKFFGPMKLDLSDPNVYSDIYLDIVPTKPTYFYPPYDLYLKAQKALGKTPQEIQQSYSELTTATEPKQ